MKHNLYGSESGSRTFQKHTLLLAIYSNIEPEVITIASDHSNNVYDIFSHMCHIYMIFKPTSTPLGTGNVFISASVALVPRLVGIYKYSWNRITIIF
jgi:hypothetical protein